MVTGGVIHSLHRISLPLPRTPTPSATTGVYQTGVGRMGREADARGCALEPIVAVHLVYVEFGRGRVAQAGTPLGRDCPPPPFHDTS